jgi:hypothetical protein
MNRSAALSYLDSEYSDLSSEVQLTSDQAMSAYSGAIDNALRWLGVAESDLSTADVAQADVLKYIALLEYFTLKRISKALAARFDVNIASSLQASRSQAFDKVNMLLAQAEAQLVGLGININGQGFELGRMTLDFQEPGLPTEFAGIGWF